MLRSVLRHVSPFLILLACGPGSRDETTAPAARVTLELSPKYAQVRIGGHVRLQVSSSPPQPLTALRWASSAPTLVSVSDSGDVVAHAAAVVQISVWLARDSTVRDVATVITTNGGTS